MKNFKLKKVLKILTWIIVVFLSLLMLFLLMGYAAMRWNFWPPNCSVLPIFQAKRVCEFSKLSENEKGQITAPNFIVKVPENVKLPDRKIVYMMDTWTINYNFNFFEDTRYNIESSFKRLKDLGINEVGVFSFIEASGNKNDFKLQEVKTPYKYMRDAAISGSDMKKLASAGKKYGLDVVIHYNVQADYTQGLKPSDLLLVGKGTGGNSAHEKVANTLGVNEKEKTEEWVKKWIDGLESSLLAWAIEAEEAKIYGIDISPQYLVPKFYPYDDYADQRFKDIIKKMRVVYSGKIFGSATGNFGGFTNVPEYINDLDGAYVDVPWIRGLRDSSIPAIKNAYTNGLNQIKELMKGYTKNIFIVISQASFEKSLSNIPYFEFNDYAEGKAQGHKADWQLQARSYQAFFEAINNQNFNGIAINNYWWDDMMDPQYADPLISMNFSIRNKPAEDIVKKWFKK
jgi:hypothetical protein